MGDANAQYQLGLMYQKGKEYEQDFEKAVRWYTLAAKQGHVLAQFNLGLMYHKGERNSAKLRGGRKVVQACSGTTKLARPAQAGAYVLSRARRSAG